MSIQPIGLHTWQSGETLGGSLGAPRGQAMGKAYNAAQAFHSHHSGRTFDAGHSQVDPWLRNVFIALQDTLNVMGQQIDANTERLDRLEGLRR